MALALALMAQMASTTKLSSFIKANPDKEFCKCINELRRRFPGLPSKCVQGEQYKFTFNSASERGVKAKVAIQTICLKY